MGLPLALKAHADGDLELAKEHYLRALEQDDKSPIIFQNYGALLKSLENYEDSEKIYLDGLKLYPNHIGINGNLANLYRKIKPVSSLEKYKFTLALRLGNGESLHSDEVRDVILDIVYVSKELGLIHIAILIVVRALTLYPNNPSLLLNLMLLLSSDEFSDNFAGFSSRLSKQLEEYVDTVDLYARFELLLGLASHQVSKDNSFVANTFYDRAIICLHELTSNKSEKAEKARSLMTINSWNISCTILKLQDFTRGWKLFEYGLQTPCPGKQRWQRALLKPFSSDQLSLWRGENLTGKNLILLEEQAIGDVMMFATLISTLIREAKSVSLFLSSRLLEIYQRSYKHEIDSGLLHIYSKKDYQSGKLKPSLFDYQSPIGSICQYRFTTVDSYSPRVPCLIADSTESKEFKAKYSEPINKPTLIGVSWRGGVKGARLKQKSIKEEQFLDLMLSVKNVRFVSLQYGNCKKVVDSWRSRGLDIIYDESVNPLKNMDTWLSQVSSCDGVLSIANTTIHGAGGLNIPTMCLLSSYADWRWLDDHSILRSYWYPSVGIARESRTDGWHSAFQVARDWMSSGCPSPVGPIQQ